MKDMHYVYATSNVCAKEIQFDVIDGFVRNIEFTGGCRGNTQGVAALAEGLTPEEIIPKLKGIDCHGGNSCPNELSKALEQYLQKA